MDINELHNILSEYITQQKLSYNRHRRSRVHLYTDTYFMVNNIYCLVHYLCVIIYIVLWSEYICCYYYNYTMFI